MEINYNNPETGNKLTLNTNKSFIFIYGKNGSGKTTFSKNDCFDSEFVFNVDYVNKNIYTVNESGAYQTSTNRNNFSNLWIGEEIVNQEKIVEKYKKEYDDYSAKLNELKTSIQNELQRNLVNIPINYAEYTDNDYLIDCDKINEEYEKYKFITHVTPCFHAAGMQRGNAARSGIGGQCLADTFGRTSRIIGYARFGSHSTE